MEMRAEDFNSTMVRLKGNAWIGCLCRHWYFNSTMVRLKEINDKQLSKMSQFQFHYGTIKRYWSF